MAAPHLRRVEHSAPDMARKVRQPPLDLRLRRRRGRRHRQPDPRRASSEEGGKAAPSVASREGWRWSCPPGCGQGRDRERGA
jgi:hypothetical protein